MKDRNVKVKKLQPTVRKKFNKKIYGFDVETYDENRQFLCGSLVSDDEVYYFRSKQNLITALKGTKFQNCIIVATNLTFDFFQLFFNNEDIIKFNTLFRGSDLIRATTYPYNGCFNSKNKGNRGERKLEFVDTMNYTYMSVEKWGKLLKVPKLEKPSFLGEYPKNDEDWKIIKDYNIQDSRISMLALKFLIESFTKLGANFKLTLASTAMSIFTTKYLDRVYYRHEERDLRNIFHAYYGGRTETFKRGRINNYYYYDVNSLYPSVMALNEFPNPNTINHTRIPNRYYIREFEGVSDVSLYCPPMRYPLLPCRYENKLFFPQGTFRGWYTHVELRKALEIGYKILDQHETYFYKANCRPFKNFVVDLYNKRMRYKKQNSPMQLVTKIIMNSLYGKFGQKYLDKDNMTPFNLSSRELLKYKRFEVLHNGLFLRVTRDTEPAHFCIPIWACYVTAYARLVLYDALHKYKAIYCDTDSIITKAKFKSSDDLGEWQLEKVVKKGIIVKPKLYFCEDIKGKQDFKAKGVGTSLDYRGFHELLDKRVINYFKFMKPKEAMRRKGFVAGEINKVSKKFNLEDSKRIWDKPFNKSKIQDSKTVNFINNMPDFNKHKRLKRLLGVK